MSKRPTYIGKLSDGTVLTTAVKVPSEQTLKNYGLTYRSWRTMLMKQRGVCGICSRVPVSSGRLVVDHEHVPGWRKMPSAKRALYVRGLLCSTCNHYILTRWATPAKLRAGAEFLERYMKRKPVD